MWKPATKGSRMALRRHVLHSNVQPNLCLLGVEDHCQGTSEDPGRQKGRVKGKGSGKVDGKGHNKGPSWLRDSAMGSGRIDAYCSSQPPP